MGVLATLYIECFNSFIMFSQVTGVLATLYIECFYQVIGGFGNQVIGVLATLYIECFYGGFGDALQVIMGFWRRFIQSVFFWRRQVIIGVLVILATTLYIECFLRLQGFWRRFIQSVLLGYREFWRRFIQSVLIGYGGFGDALYRVFSQVMGVLATLYIECFLRLWGFWRHFIQSFLRLWGFWRRFIQSVLLGYGGFRDALYRVL